MMKKIFLTLAIAVATATTAAAATYESLVIQQNDGTTYTFGLYGEEEYYNPVTITFENGKLIATQNGQQTTLEVSSLDKMYFGSTTGIQTVSDGLDTGDVFDMQGRRVATKINLKTLQNQLPKGVYIVKNGDKTVKMTVK
ncbi:MAG: T9SS type A sorting domain-containing protein [Prevotella sp.]|nr:T9SS type A sorting domain-containing protein [Prevotella sp.]MBR6456721.1 T9SS type A sorting domain-containing protein [Prevotella sp.]MBR6494949.1 T9SS type A sorting domain-containing protein [Prevotella sp.]